MNDRAKYQAALSRQRRDRELSDVPVPYRITTALDLCGLYGPEVDRALGGEEPMVDQWETGELVPTSEQIEALATLTGYPAAYFYKPATERAGVAFMCKRSGPNKGCEQVSFGPPPAPPKADVIPMRGGQPGYRCLIPRCPLRGRRQSAGTPQAAAAAFRRHYLDHHYQPPAPAGAKR
ncbi:hypothetical protein [Nonomuraea dietziae]|uniref:hypothetical protein n=1 Tax=Nonomuraea dietziae TaxID=65515 RepID=UPI0033C882E5